MWCYLSVQVQKTNDLKILTEMLNGRVRSEKNRRNISNAGLYNTGF